LDEGGARRGRAAAFFVPGRIEVLGKHTDYAGGRSLTAASDHGVLVLAVPREDDVLRVRDLRQRSEARIKIGVEGSSVGPSWKRYPETVVRRLCRDFGTVSGTDVIFESDLPVAAGMSSSSALLISVYQPLALFSELPDRERYRKEIDSLEDLASYLGALENGRAFGSLSGGGGVGTFGGSEDQTAILCSRPGQLNRYSYAPVRLEGREPWPSDWSLVVAVSGVRASKAGRQKDSYNRLSLLASSAVEVWNRATGSKAPHLAEVLKEADSGEVRTVLGAQDHRSFSRRELCRRLDHFVEESEGIVPAAWAAISGADEEIFGRLCARSQSLAEELLDNQVRETSFLAREATEQGAFAASAFGAGFGGSVWAAVPRGEAPEFLDRWQKRYVACFPEHETSAEFLVSAVSGAARRIGRPVQSDEVCR
jgi:galactokinase